MADDKTPAAAVMGGRKLERHPLLHIDAEVPVIVTGATEAVHLVTESVDRTGMVLRTDHPLPVRELVQLDIHLGGEEGVLSAVAVVRQSVTAAAARRLGASAGMAVQLYGLSGTDRRRWDLFLRRLLRQSGRSTEDLGASGLGDALEQSQPPQLDLREASVRTSTRLRTAGPDWKVAQDEVTKPVRAPEPGGLVVAPANQVALEEILTRDLILGGLFIPTDAPLALGARVRVQVRHPRSGATFPFECVVDRGPELDHLGQRGFGVHFLAIDDDLRGRFREFVESGAPPKAFSPPA